ncbi:hypothetical protein ON010_g11332 [Phytophthora cinnamomi]|nr:hypothetical protein ON010_g11332 [Phytophthora cinnamomi]
MMAVVEIGGDACLTVLPPYFYLPHRLDMRLPAACGNTQQLNANETAEQQGALCALVLIANSACWRRGNCCLPEPPDQISWARALQLAIRGALGGVPLGCYSGCSGQAALREHAHHVGRLVRLAHVEQVVRPHLLARYEAREALEQLADGGVAVGLRDHHGVAVVLGALLRVGVVAQQRGDATSGHDIHVGAAVDEQRHDLEVLRDDGGVKRVRAALAAGRHRRASVEKKFHDVDASVAARCDQRRHAGVVGHVGVRTFVQQQSHNVRSSHSRRNVQARGTVRHGRVSVGVVEQDELHGVRVADAAGHVQADLPAAGLGEVRRVQLVDVAGKLAQHVLAELLHERVHGVHAHGLDLQGWQGGALGLHVLLFRGRGLFHSRLDRARGSEVHLADFRLAVAEAAVVFLLLVLVHHLLGALLSPTVQGQWAVQRGRGIGREVFRRAEEVGVGLEHEAAVVLELLTQHGAAEAAEELVQQRNESRECVATLVDCSVVEPRELGAQRAARREREGLQHRVQRVELAAVFGAAALVGGAERQMVAVVMAPSRFVHALAQRLPEAAELRVRAQRGAHPVGRLRGWRGRTGVVLGELDGEEDLAVRDLRGSIGTSPLRAARPRWILFRVGKMQIGAGAGGVHCGAQLAAAGASVIVVMLDRRSAGVAPLQGV